MFCPKCGSILHPKTDGRKKLLVCSCGFKESKRDDIKITEAVDNSKKKIEIAEDLSTQALPVTKEDCPKCNHGKAYFWTQQTRAGDEAETKFFQCVKCSHRWRDYN